MWRARALLVTGLTTSLSHARSESACGSPLIVTVTVTAPVQITETLSNAANPSSLSGYSSPASSVTPVGIASSIEATKTLSSTTYLTRTKVVSADDAPIPLPGKPHATESGHYYYAVDEGTTIWLGSRTPTSGATLATNTMVVTVQPQPEHTGGSIVVTTSQSSSALEDETSTSYETFLSTSFHTSYLTKELVLEPGTTSRPSVKLTPYPGSYGWNSTLFIAQETEGSSSVSASASSPTWPASGIAASAPSYAIKRHHPRQVGAVVSATINGVVVSWTNAYDGPTSSTYSVAEAPPPFSNATQTGSISPPAPTSSCGSDAGLFTINFDDLPHFSTESALSDIPPIFNPYRKLFFNSGYGYVPPPNDPFPPISPPQLAVYNYHNDSVSQTSVDDGLVLHGEIGAGPRVNQSAYWIDAYSTWIGCANEGPGECTINFIGYDRFKTQMATQTVTQAYCPGLVNCKLGQVRLTDQFRQLAGLQILAYVDETPVTFYMDDLSLGWSNNSCAAQLQRSSRE
ncbi:MAG: hypothetical protein LQ345_003604 [Seirophora villosa]|nr:MAG: hypothetical protein LQ345_003604 [Seirophora villosa]